MGRKPKSDDEKLAEIQQKLIANLGIDPKLFQNHVQDNPDTPDDVIREAETVLFYYSTEGQGFRHQICPICNKTFAYYYRIALGPGMKCSNNCRKEALRRIGIAWSPAKKPGDRYSPLEKGENEPFNYPATISPEALDTLRDVLPPGKVP